VAVASTFRRLGQSELLPRYIFAESLYARRRVLEVGAVASTLGESARFLAARGARVVVAADSDLTAVQQAQATFASPTLRFRPTVFDDFEGGSFDLVLVADLAPYVRAPELLRDLARLVAKNGHLLGGLRNPAGLALATVLDPEDQDAPPTYGQLLDALSAHFDSVEVATQSPVLGYQLAFERGEGLQVDGSLAGSSEAAYFIVLAGHEPVRSFDPTWVQLPPEPLAFTGGKLEDAATRAREWKERSERLKSALATKTGELEAATAQLTELTLRSEQTAQQMATLAAQLESVRDRPDLRDEREALAHQVHRLEAEITVARERAIDSEGRATAAKRELEGIERLRKDALVQTLAAQETVRLEKARREEALTQLEDSRLRLTKAYEEAKKGEARAADERLLLERTRREVQDLLEAVAERDRGLDDAKRREAALADARSQSLAAIEHLQSAVAEARLLAERSAEATAAKEVDLQSMLRSLESEQAWRRGLEAELAQERGHRAEVSQALEQRNLELSGSQTELTAARAAHTRALRDIETLASSERTWRETAGQYEQRLADTTTNVALLSDQLAQVEAALEAETARARRLERDLSTAITAERTAREQAEAALAAAQAQVGSLDDSLTIARRLAVETDASLVTERQRVASLEVQEQSLQLRLAEMQSALDEGARLRGETDASLVGVRQQLAETEAALEKSWQTEQSLEASVRTRDTQLAEGQKALDSVRASLAQLQASADDVESSLRATLAVREAKVEGLKRQSAEQEQAWASQAAQFEARLEAAAESLRQEATLRGARDAEVARLFGVVAERDTSLAVQVASLEESQSDLERQRAQFENVSSQLQQVEADLKITQQLASDAQATDLANRAAAERQRETLEATLAAERSQAANAQGELQQALNEERAQRTELEARFAAER
jgi:golgin subfamily B member 1